MSGNSFQLKRLGVVMEPEPGDSREAGGVLNPGGTRGRDGEYYLFPRVVEVPNYSRIGIARVVFEDGEPIGAERLGYALEPDAAFERNTSTAGCEDARVTFILAIDHFVMVYSSYGPRSSRLALAVSKDCVEWRRLGPVLFSYEEEWFADFNLFDNKDAFFFPEPVRNPAGEWSLALVHRPDFDVGDEEPFLTLPRGIEEARPGMWISYVSLEDVQHNLGRLVDARQHQPLAFARQPWEELKIGGGTPPVRTESGWLMVYHGVSGSIHRDLDHQPEVGYRAGIMVLDYEDPRRVLYRSERPVLEPESEEERVGVVDNVVFPTALDTRENGRIDVYYGMADSKIGVARLDL